MDSIRDINANYGTTIVLVEQNLKQGLAGGASSGGAEPRRETL